MKQISQLIPEPQPLKLIGRRALISIDMLPFMNRLTPLALILATLRSPPGLIYPRKIFNHLKKALLQKTFKQKTLKTQQKCKLIIRGYELSRKQQLQKENPLLTPVQMNIIRSFNLSSVKEWFDAITQPSMTSQNMNFIESIPMIVEKRRKSQMRVCLRLRKVINEIIKLEQKKDLEGCEKIYQQKFMGITIPWTQNIYMELEEFGKKLWCRYLNDELYDMRVKRRGGNKVKRIKRKSKQSGKCGASERKEMSIIQKQ